MSNSNKNDIENENSLEGITDFGSFINQFKQTGDFDNLRNQFQRAIDVAAQDLDVNIDIDNFLKTSGSTFEDNGWQFKINNIQLAQSNTNANNAQNLPSEDEEDIKSDVNQNILSEIIAGLDKQKQNKVACTKLFLDNLEAFELKIDSAEILWLLEQLKHSFYDRYQNKLSEIFGRYIKKLIHRSEILQLEETEQKLFTDSLQALASCVDRIIFNRDWRFSNSGIIEEFKTNFQQLEKTVTQRMFSANSASTQESIDRAKSESEVVNDVFVILINEIIVLNALPTGWANAQYEIMRRIELFCDLMHDIRINSKNLSLGTKSEVIKFLSKENSNSDSRKEFDYLDYHNWDWETLTDLDSMFKLTIDRFDYYNLDIPINFDDLRKWRDPDEGVILAKPINYYCCLIGKIRMSGNFFKSMVFKLVTELGVPDVIDVIKKYHLSLTSLLCRKYVLEREVLVGELLGDTKNILIALLGCYKAKSKINSIIADLWEENFKARINYFFLDKKYNLCQLMDKLPKAQINYFLDKKYNLFQLMDKFLGEIQKGIAKDMEKLFTEVKEVFSSEVQPKTASEAFKILFEKNENDKLKELINDGNIFNLFLEYVEQDVKNNRSNEHADLAQFNSLITKIKNKNNSDELSIDDKSSIAEFFLSEDFGYVNNLAKITNKLKKLILKDDISDDNISSKENRGNSAKKGVDSTKNDLKINEQAKNELSSSLSNAKNEKEKEKANLPTQQKQEFELEITLSNSEAIILSPGSCKTAMAGLRGCSDFCYQICLIKEAIEQQKGHQASECWKQLYAKLTWGEAIKVTFYSWFMFKIVKWWRGSENMEIKSTMPTQSDTNFSKMNRDDNKFSIPKSKEKTFGI